MTDQPLPLKPSDDKEIDLRSCPFCGDLPRGVGARVECMNTDCFGFDTGVFYPRIEWNHAYCWKLLAEKEAELFASKNRLEVLHLTIRAKTVKIQEQAETIKIYEETLKSFALGLFSSRHAKLISQQALDRVRGK